ncbi:FKBP-type peptidyl-prolyl cis-trans isomerase [Candidatus Dependentiae bacterium]|nr:FKBP-type peptidyl-prolyl cis-trans isomerase [Candidatus Dependentiae bacterium]
MKTKLLFFTILSLILIFADTAIFSADNKQKLDKNSTSSKKIKSAEINKTQQNKNENSSKIEELKTLKEKVSYSIGIDIGKNLKTQSIDIDKDILLKGFSAGYEGGVQIMTEEEVKQTMMNLQNEIRTKQQAAKKEAAAKNLRESIDFLEKNKTEPGIIVLPSGLQYKIIKEGTGSMPQKTDTVITHYKGTLLNGIEFDSSYKRNQPAEFKVSSVIPGWTEALQLMKTGSKWKLFIPPQLGYGERGAGKDIGPNSALIFEIELIGIK